MQMYPDREAGLTAGVPVDHLKTVHVIFTGPFKGRRYHLSAEGRVGARITPDLTDAELNDLADRALANKP